MSKVTTEVPMLAVPFDLSRGQDIDFCRRVEEAMDQGQSNLHLDCSALELVHSSHIGLLWKAKEICRQKSTTVTLEETSSSLIRTLRALDLMDEFTFGEACDLDLVPTTQPIPIQSGEPHTGLFAADVAGVDQALCEFLELLDGWRLTEEMKFDLRTLFYEVATNIRCHSGLQADSRIRYRAALINGAIQLVFEDNGKPFNPTSLPDAYNPEAAAHNHQTRGFGISMIRRLADEIEYTLKNDTTNVLSLTKRYGDQ